MAIWGFLVTVGRRVHYTHPPQSCRDQKPMSAQLEPLQLAFPTSVTWKLVQGGSESISSTRGLHSWKAARLNKNTHLIASSHDISENVLDIIFFPIMLRIIIRLYKNRKLEQDMLHFRYTLKIITWRRVILKTVIYFLSYITSTIWVKQRATSI